MGASNAARRCFINDLPGEVLERILDMVASSSPKRNALARLSTVSRLWRAALPFNIAKLYLHSFRNPMPTDRRKLAKEKQSAKIMGSQSKSKRRRDGLGEVQLQKLQRTAAVMFAPPVAVP